MSNTQKLQEALYHAEQINALLDQAYEAHVEATSRKAA